MQTEVLDQTAVPARAREVAVEAAREAGRLLRDRLETTKKIEYKGAVDLVTDADRASESSIVARIRDVFADHVLFGEEGTGGPAATIDRTGFVWIIDPLDGTTNFAHGYPHFAVSIALEHNGATLLGVVYDPMRDELFLAERGQGATLNGEAISVSDVDMLIRALMATGFRYELDQRAENAAIWDVFLNATQGTRRDGSAALNLCYVARGRLDGFWERPLQPWDMAAGALLVREAGGTVTGYFADAFDPFQREIVANNGHLHAHVLEVVQEHALR